jgi:hypothetical protein
MDGVTIYLFGVLTGVLIVIGCAVSALCWNTRDLNQRGEQDDG